MFLELCVLETFQTKYDRVNKTNTVFGKHANRQEYLTEARTSLPSDVRREEDT